MIKKAKQFDYSFKFKNKDHVMTEADLDLRPKYKQFFINLAPYLPDMEFVVNLNDEPRVLKRQECRAEKDWVKCSCDKDYEVPAHGAFLKPCIWKAIYEKAPIFSAAVLPECFADILVPSNFHIRHEYFKIKDLVPW